MSKMYVTETNNNLELFFPYNETIKSAIKSTTNYSFNGSSKTWIIDKASAYALYQKISDWNTGIDINALKEAVDKIEAKKRECAEKAAAEKSDRQTEMMKKFSALERKPFQHQVIACDFLLEQKKALLCDEMGGGKTMSSILAASQIEGNRLIICPATLKLNWKKEIQIVDKDAIINVVSKEIDQNAGWNIINYDILNKFKEQLLAIDWAVVIADEVHYCKAVSNAGTADSTRAKVFLQIAKKAKNLYALTGTPITSRPKDLFNLLKAIDHPLSGNWWHYGKVYCNGYKGHFGWDFTGASNTRDLNEKIKGKMLRRLKKDMLDLPEKSRTYVPVEVNLREYKRLVDEYMTERDTIEEGRHLVFFNAMRHELAKLKVSHTIEIAKDIIDADEPVVIFTNYNAVVDEIMNAFGDNAVKLTGDVNVENRQKAVERFQKGEVKIFVSNLIAGGVGITLTRAKNMLINDMDWVPGNHIQAEDRIHRIGQTENVNINYVYVQDTEIDNIMTTTIADKMSVINSAIDGGEGYEFDIVKAVKEAFKSLQPKTKKLKKAS